ncbi:T9SS type A sorting domain-containing protein [Polaribacter sp. Hel1_85]|uniref:T9SS type A sorting domain-containing protein n=1 Tax=Polaribacter sp. Hel1_85 TaxID=1250005 RepID=UPI00052C3BCB|nr:T9SS type A sorting domain-containing protein [Polaribacter sp. Hel1_85]KGL58540.1 conserved hypothetical protein, TolB-like domain protein [Polaribacter sp. Hel1_85]
MTTHLQKSTTRILFLFTLILSISLSAQNEPFNCDYNAYLFQRNDIYALDLASGSSYLVKEDVTEGNINAVGYNPADGYIWGALTNGSQTIVRIGKSFNVESFYIDELPTSSIYIGDVSSEGIYYLKGAGTKYYTIDLNPESENYTKFISQGTFSLNLSIHDWAFNSVDGHLYTVEKGTNHLYRINATTSEIIDLGEVPILTGLNYHFGAVYFDASGRFYVSANQTGTVYMIKDVQGLEVGGEMESNLFAFGPASSSNDGARCPTAPVPQEDCINGIDDDGDGLVDCDDPACSGVAACPVITPEVSSGNEGGLESNDRLSQQINKRNYLRKKSNFKFDKLKAKKVIKTKSYKKTLAKSKSTTFELKDLIPLDVLSGATAVESSPLDLIAITNATELYSVDYVKDDETIAVVLATKTENGVYEHTKFICDRLLGAELLSVSTIELFGEEGEDEGVEGVQFIKSIIKNSNGTKEFVLSFSGRLINSEENFEIDSHWNIDKYEAGATYYNFQIWSNSVDDLLTLGHEAIALFDIQRPVSNYNTSTPPPVFVKKGKYVNGTLELELINVRRTKSVVIDAGFKRTETSNTEYFNNTVELTGNYIESLVIETGNIFDIGFRIENEYDLTPDDLFMSDGVWGNDDSPEGTTVNEFSITQNDNIYAGSGYRVERNISLKATTSEYVSAFRSFTPRFTAIDLSDYDVLELDAFGTGDVEITIVKESIDAWENQYRTTIKLNETESHFAIPFAHFVSVAGGDLDLNDAVNIVFTMSSDGVEVLNKEMSLKDIQFTQQVLSVGNEVIAENEAILMPNPMHVSSELSFYAETNSNTKIEVYNLTGALIRRTEENTAIGNNKVSLQREGLKPGMYFVKIRNDFRNYKAIKLVVN